jgi:hypothetical protein
MLKMLANFTRHGANVMIAVYLTARQRKNYDRAWMFMHIFCIGISSKKANIYGTVFMPVNSEKMFEKLRSIPLVEFMVLWSLLHTGMHVCKKENRIKPYS